MRNNGEITEEWKHDPPSEKIVCEIKIWLKLIRLVILLSLTHRVAIPRFVND